MFQDLNLSHYIFRQMVKQSDHELRLFRVTKPGSSTNNAKSLESILCPRWSNCYSIVHPIQHSLSGFRNPQEAFQHN